MCQSAPSPPPAPDYKGAAQAESAGSAQAGIGSNIMAHPNIYTPLGSQTWDQSGVYSVPSIGGNPGFDIPMWTQNIQLSPDQQSLFDKQNQLSQGILGLGNTSLDQTRASLGQPMDMQSVDDIYNRAYETNTARLGPEWQQRQEQMQTQLAQQGLVPGGEAYDNAMRNFNEGRNDAYSTARRDAISQMPQTYQLEAASRMQPLTEFNAIRTGAQPQMPQFQASQYAGMQGPQLLNAANMQGQWGQQNYQNQLGASNAFMSGLMDLAGAGMQAYAMSDRRLKSNIRRIGKLGQFALYAYRIFGRDEVGVMADEVLAVKPEAVAVHPSGYLMVNYGALCH